MPLSAVNRPTKPITGGCSGPRVGTGFSRFASTPFALPDPNTTLVPGRKAPNSQAFRLSPSPTQIVSSASPLTRRSQNNKNQRSMPRVVSARSPYNV